VLVEEVEAMLPASYADEPLGSDGKANPERQDIIVSGPRFATLVKLPQSPSEIAVTPTVPTNPVEIEPAKPKPIKTKLLREKLAKKLPARNSRSLSQPQHGRARALSRVMSHINS